MNFTTPNSAGFADIDEANVGSTAVGYAMHFSKKKRKRRVREFNTCHAPDSGKFCTTKQASAKWKGTVRRSLDKGRANRVMGRLEKQMKNVGKNRPWVVYTQKGAPQQSRLDRANTLRKRMDVAGPIARRDRENSFVGTFKRIFLSKDPAYRGRKK